MVEGYRDLYDAKDRFERSDSESERREIWDEAKEIRARHHIEPKEFSKIMDNKNVHARKSEQALSDHSQVYTKFEGKLLQE